jgi:hypothetical protein
MTDSQRTLHNMMTENNRNRRSVSAAYDGCATPVLSFLISTTAALMSDQHFSAVLVPTSAASMVRQT